jgi:hypothetical protein
VPIGIAQRVVDRVPGATFVEFDGGHYPPPPILRDAFTYLRE